MISVIAINSASDNRKITAMLKKEKIRNKTECTGLEEKTTKKLDKIVTVEKI